jgi:hypothetical protein
MLCCCSGRLNSLLTPDMRTADASGDMDIIALPSWSYLWNSSKKKSVLYSNRYNTWAFYFHLDHYYLSPQHHHVLEKAEHICDLVPFRRNWELKFSIYMPALILTIMYIINRICELGLCLNSDKPLHLYKSLTMWSFGGLIIRYQRFQFRLHIRRHQLGNVSRFHVAHFFPEVHVHDFSSRLSQTSFEQVCYNITGTQLSGIPQ